MYSIGNIVDNTVITTYGASWVVYLPKDQLESDHIDKCLILMLTND